MAKLGFDNKLHLEFGGKPLCGYHAAQPPRSSPRATCM